MMPAVNRFKKLDVRDRVGRGIEPLPEIRERVDKLKPDEGLIDVAPFLPSPLIEKLGSQGFASKWSVAQARIGWFTSGVRPGNYPDHVHCAG
jgi:hypothetical protein